jgi:hypothetical protein
VLSITRVGAESEVALVKATEIIACVGKVTSEISKAAAIFSIAMDEKNYSFSLMGLTGVSVIL